MTKKHWLWRTDKKMVMAEKALDDLQQNAKQYVDLQEKAHESETEVKKAEQNISNLLRKDRDAWFNIAGALLKEKYDRVLTNRRNASKPRRKRGHSPESRLRLRALQSLIYKHPSITVESLCDKIDADGRLTIDDDDVEFQVNEESLIIRDLSVDPEITLSLIKLSSLRKYLSDARNA